VVKKVIILSAVLIISCVGVFFSIRGIASIENRSAEFNKRLEEHQSRLNNLIERGSSITDKIGKLEQSVRIARTEYSSEAGSIRKEYSGISESLAGISTRIKTTNGRVQTTIERLEKVSKGISSLENSFNK